VANFRCDDGLTEPFLSLNPNIGLEAGLPLNIMSVAFRSPGKVG